MDLSKLRSIAVRATQKAYPRIGLRESDIILASFPKSGNTWMRFIWANMVSLKELGGREINFHNITHEVGAEYDSYSYGNVEYESLPRLVKTHREYDDRFKVNRSIYLVRNPADTLLSFYDYKRNHKDNKYDSLSESQFLRDPEVGVKAWCKHVTGWTSEADIIIAYEEMKKNALNVVHRVLDHFCLTDIDKQIVRRAVQRSSFQNIRKVEEKKGRPRENQFKKGFRFAQKARLGEWKERLSKRDIKFIDKEVDNIGLSDGLKEKMSMRYIFN